MGVMGKNSSEFGFTFILTFFTPGHHGHRVWFNDNFGRYVFVVSDLFEKLLSRNLTVRHQRRAIKLIFPLIAGIGFGGLFNPPLIGLQAAMPFRDMATSTATYGLIRQLGSTVGLSVGQAIWSTVRPFPSVVHVLA